MAPSLNEILAKGSASFRRANAGLAGVLQADAGNKASANRNMDARLSNKGAKRDAPPALERLPSIQTGDVGAIDKRPRVNFTLYRNQLLDVESQYASTKAVLDGLVESGLIPGDRTDQIVLHVEQVRVPRKMEGTGIAIIYKDK